MRLVSVILAVGFVVPSLTAADTPFELVLRSRKSPLGEPPVAAKDVKTTWDGTKSAIIVCDMWDHHWCKSAEARCGELAGPMNAMLQAARAKGVFVIHAPSACMEFYKDTTQRKRAINSPTVPAPTISTSLPGRWGSWCYSDGSREAIPPLDASDQGCDCKTRCSVHYSWKRQTAAIEIGPEDAISENGQEIWNLLAERKIENVALCGVHLNMCVMGRPFGIRQMVRSGKNVALIRDMTDTMYNPERPPNVDHFAGTELMVEHVERYWCPSFESTAFTGQPAFRFKNDPRSAK